MKLSKAETKLHEEAQALVDADRPLHLGEREFVLEHWNPMAEHNVTTSASFFTPDGVAHALAQEAGPRAGQRLVDICAGIGRLAFNCWLFAERDLDMVCIELNPEFVKVGKRVLPEAKWICADALDEATWKGMEDFHCAVSNPPYGNIKHEADTKWIGLPLRGWSFEYKVAAVAAKMAVYGVLIVPHTVAGFRMTPYGFKEIPTPKHKRFTEITGYTLEPNCGFDLSLWKDDWKGVKDPSVELVVLGEWEDGVHRVPVLREVEA